MTYAIVSKKKSESLLFTRELNVEIRQFRYGVAFLVLNVNFTPLDIVPLSYILKFNANLFLGRYKMYLISFLERMKT